ncbi:MAG: D-glycero-beta-D-manno-heptose-7-phosphate kinase [Patescibacteria group bacterium]
MKNLIEIVENFKGKKIGVIGDLMLDHFIWGNVDRISPEAPIPIVLVTKESFMPGGAGNTATNITALGGKVFVVGLAGKDLAGKTLLSEFKKLSINTGGILLHNQKPTTQKIRVVARSQQVVRVDKEDSQYINSDIEKKLLEFIGSHIKKWDGLVVSDYAKGVITENLSKTIVNLAVKYKKPIICDVKPKHAPFFKNATLLSPNYKEALAIAGISDNDIKKAGKIIQKQLNCSVLLTQGAEGITIFEDDKIKHFPAMAREVFDVSGAGDTVTAVVALALSAGASLEQATIIANHAAGIAVGKLGTAVVLSEELKKDLQN